MAKEYISFDEFVSNTGFSKRTVEKRCKKNEIPGIEYKGNEYLVLSGTRYPCDLHRYKLDTSSKKRFVLLKTISENKYISHRDLKLEKRQFKEMIAELLGEGFIKDNGLKNKFGANRYDCTIKGDQYLDDKKNEKVFIAARIAGTFVGKVISEVYGNEG